MDHKRVEYKVTSWMPWNVYAKCPHCKKVNGIHKQKAISVDGKSKHVCNFCGKVWYTQ